MGLLRKRYDMIALILQSAPKVHHNLLKAIIVGDLLCGRLAAGWCFFALALFSLFSLFRFLFYIRACYWSDGVI
jgi:hypothetical protein